MRITFHISETQAKHRNELESKVREIIKGKNADLKGGGKGWFLPAGAEYIYKGRNRLYRVKAGDKSLIIKDFKRPNALNRHVYTTLRKSKARRSYENAVGMSELGFNTPAPVAWCEVKQGGALLWSFYICEELPGAAEMRHWENNPDCETLLPAFAREMLRLHRANVWIKDFSPGNILYKKHEGETYSFYHVDLNRLKFNEKNRKNLMRMFRAINLDRGETARLARLYAEAAGENPTLIEGEALRQLEGYFKVQKRKKILKNYFLLIF